MVVTVTWLVGVVVVVEVPLAEVSPTRAAAEVPPAVAFMLVLLAAVVGWVVVVEPVVAEVPNARKLWITGSSAAAAGSSTSAPPR